MGEKTGGREMGRREETRGREEMTEEEEYRGEGEEDTGRRRGWDRKGVYNSVKMRGHMN